MSAAFEYIDNHDSTRGFVELGVGCQAVTVEIGCRSWVLQPGQRIDWTKSGASWVVTEPARDVGFRVSGGGPLVTVTGGER